eukprot:12269575-Alexandrium_andersonii.AAC.1
MSGILARYSIPSDRSSHPMDAQRYQVLFWHERQGSQAWEEHLRQQREKQTSLWVSSISTAP